MYQTDLNYDTVWQKKKKPALCSVTGVATEIVTPKDEKSYDAKPLYLTPVLERKVRMKTS